MVCFFLFLLFILYSEKNNKKMIRLIKYLLILLVALNCQLLCQENKNKDVLKIFLRIEEGINQNSIDKFSTYFSPKNYLSLNNSSVGYFSDDQSYYVLKDFFSINEPISFKLNNIITETANPFASGTLRYFNRGIKKTALVFITLHLIDNKWKISQITVN